jgi:hypothetical protein
MEKDFFKGIKIGLVSNVGRKALEKAPVLSIPYNYNGAYEDMKSHNFF